MSAWRRVFRLPWRTEAQIRSDVDEELRFHFESRVEALVSAGADPARAREQTKREFGDVEDARRYMSTMDRRLEAAQRRTDWMSDFWNDVVYGVRKLRSSPTFTITVVATLALGIGANTAIFSVVNSLLLEPLPFPRADHIVRVTFTQQGHNDVSTPPDIIDYSARSATLEGLSTIEGATANVIRPGADPERVQGVRVNANWFTLLRSTPAAGRFFLPGEDKPGAANVVVVSEEFWRRDLGADPHAVGSALSINGDLFTVIGITPAGRHYPVTADLWMTRRFTAADLSDQTRGARWLGLLGRVKDGVSVAAADREVERVSEALEKRFPEVYRERRAHAVSLQSYIYADMRLPLFVMLAAVTLVLLVACANVANLMLVRATARHTELAIRAALGAGQGRVARQLITESGVLTVIGAGAGVALAALALRVMVHIAPQTLFLVTTASIDGRVLGVTIAISVMTAMLFGALPLLGIRSGDVASALRAGARGVRTGSAGRRTNRLVVVGELALAVTLLTGAGLLLRSFQRLVQVDPGFRPEGVLTMKLRMPDRAYGSPDKQRAFVSRVEANLGALPGVRVAAASDFVPLDGSGFGFGFMVRGRPVLRVSDRPNTELREVTPSFFAAMGIPLLKGRSLSVDDRPTSTAVLVVNREFVRRTFGAEDPIGKQIKLDWGAEDDTVLNKDRTIVGVVGDVKGNSLDEAVFPTAYVPYAQSPSSALTIELRTAVAPATLIAPARRVIHDIDPTMPIYGVMTMEERVMASIGNQRFFATLISVFAGVALIIASVGLYGVIAYGVSQRQHELGVRVALGATRTRITRMVLGDGMRLTIFGLIAGIAAAIVASRVLMRLLFGVSAADPWTLGAVTLTLAGVALLASYVPARRAAAVDPVTSFRGD